MKKLSILFIILSFSVLTFAQDKAKFYTVMKPLATQINQTPFTESLHELSNKMERIAAAEPTEWLPSYWVAYCQITESLKEEDGDKKDLILDKAEKHLNRAAEISSNNDEIEFLQAYYSNARMIVNPMTRWMKYGELMEKHLANAKELNPENPRVSLLQAESLYYTPKMFGGGKKAAKPVFEEALVLYEKFTPKNEMMPNWGEGNAMYYLSLYDKAK